MINIKSNRIDYGAQLHPPEGFVLEYAVGTTYSLDLHTLLIVPVAMFNKQFLDLPSEEKTPIQIIDALKKAKSKLRVFCQSGKINISSSFYTAFSLLESCIEQIPPPNHLASFHPKCWILRFKNDKTDQILYRSIVMSRNITFDKSWDLSYSTEGFVDSRLTNRNPDLHRFVVELSNRSKASLPTSFIDDLEKVEFMPASGFTEQDVEPYGFDSAISRKSNSLADFLENNSFNQALVISPFWNKSIIDKLKDKTNGLLTIIGRRVEFNKLSAETFQECDAYILNPVIKDLADTEEVSIFQDQTQAEAFPTSKNGKVFFQELHAKAFFLKKGTQTHWWIGSTNASHSGIYRNCECLVHLISPEKAHAPEQVLGSLIDQKDEQPLFVKYTNEHRNEHFDEEEKDFRKLVQLICSLFDAQNKSLKIICTERKEGLFELQMTISDFNWPDNEHFDITIKLASDNSGMWKDFKANQTLFFQNISEINLSQFFQIKIKATSIQDQYHEFIVLAQIEGLPSTRDKYILSHLIENTDRLFRYIAYLLGEPGSTSVTNKSQISYKNSIKQESIFSMLGIPMMEKLLESTSRNPMRLKQVSELLSEVKLEEDNRLEEFKRFWAPFNEFVKSEIDSND